MFVCVVFQSFPIFKTNHERYNNWYDWETYQTIE